MKGLRVAQGFALPLEVAGEAVGILAKRGAGKTNTGIVLAEEMFANEIQFVAVDPVDSWWGLRSKLPVPIIGGQHGDLELSPEAGKLLADVVLESGQSVVLCTSDFPSKAAVARFVRDFLDALYRGLGKSPRLLHVFLEEADEFAPQKPFKEETRMLAAVEQFVRRGRGRGGGITVITQRSASLNKNVLEQVDVLFAMRTTGPNDRKAIEGWVGKNAEGGEGEGVIASLPGLADGECWVWNPEREILEKVKVRLRRSLDVAGRLRAGEKRVDVQMKPIDLEALGARIQETVERQKANDPRELRQQIRVLQRQLAEREKETVVEKVVERVPIEVPVLSEEDMDRLRRLIAEARSVADDVDGLPVALRQASEQMSEAVQRARSAPPLEQGERREAVRREPVTMPPARRPAQAAVAVDAHVTPAQFRILGALAQLEAIGVADADKRQVALFAKVSPKSSGYTNNLGALRTAGLLHYPTPGRVALSEEGRSLVEADVPATVEELHEFVFDLVGRSKAAILRVLIARHPESMEKSELAEQAGVSASSSGYTNNLGNLRSLGLIEYPQPGRAVASDLLFLGAAV